jgi:hypothetical protein
VHPAPIDRALAGRCARLRLAAPVAVGVQDGVDPLEIHRLDDQIDVAAVAQERIVECQHRQDGTLQHERANAVLAELAGEPDGLGDLSQAHLAVRTRRRVQSLGHIRRHATPSRPIERRADERCDPVTGDLAEKAVPAQANAGTPPDIRRRGLVARRAQTGRNQRKLRLEVHSPPSPSSRSPRRARPVTIAFVTIALDAPSCVEYNASECEKSP